VTTWLFRPGRRVGFRVPAALSRPGRHRVVLQLPGDKPVLVIRQLRRITGADLVSAKAMVESAPVVVAENLSQESAAEAAHLLQAAGARATVTPMDDAPTEGAT
jgi:ribosomal protein L7/L12